MSSIVNRYKNLFITLPKCWKLIVLDERNSVHELNKVLSITIEKGTNTTGCITVIQVYTKLDTNSQKITQLRYT